MTLVDELLHSLPADRPVRSVHIGLNWTTVCLTSPEGDGPGRCGIAKTLLPPPRPGHGHAAVEEAGSLHEKSAHQLAALARTPPGPERSVGWAAINALLPVDEKHCVELNARDFLIKQGRDRKIAIVGHFPFVEAVRPVARSLWVLELNPAPGDLPARQAPEIIPQADIVAITSMTLLNGTFEELAGLWRPETLVMMLGPSTPFTPLLFERGVDVLSGTVIADADRVNRYICQGASFHQVKGVRLLTLVRDGLAL